MNEIGDEPGEGAVVVGHDGLASDLSIGTDPRTGRVSWPLRLLLYMLGGIRKGLPSGLNAWSVLRAADSSFTIRISAAASAGNWLAVPEGKALFLLVMTLLDTPTAGSSGVIDLAMPGIERLDCADA